MDLYFDRHDGEAATIEQFVQCFADARQARSHAVHALVLAGRHAGGGRIEGAYDAADQDLHARARADDAADAGPADQGADGDPARARPRRPDGRDLPLKLGGGSP